MLSYQIEHKNVAIAIVVVSVRGSSQLPLEKLWYETLLATFVNRRVIMLHVSELDLADKKNQNTQEVKKNAI